MSRQWYGSIDNRLEEGRQFVEEIKVGTGVTEYSWSDRQAFEVTKVVDQKHITIRRFDHKHIGNGCMDNNWELISNPDNEEYDLVKKGNSWYTTQTITAEWLKPYLNEDNQITDFEVWQYVCHWDFDINKVLEKGKQTKYHKRNISIGKAEYYYDYEF